MGEDLFFIFQVESHVVVWTLDPRYAFRVYLKDEKLAVQ